MEPDKTIFVNSSRGKNKPTDNSSSDECAYGEQFDTRIIDSESELEALVSGSNSSSHFPSTCGYGSSGDQSEERLRRKLRFFFMNPIEKWQSKRRFPYKFIVQVFKIILVTVQLCLFAHNRYNHVNYSWDNRIAFSHLFLKGWDATREVNAYPPAVGNLALYKIDDFYSTLDYAVVGYANLTNAIGPYSYAEEDNTMTPPVLSVTVLHEIRKLAEEMELDVVCTGALYLKRKSSAHAGGY
uniref:Mucolipin extracytosolic domain-containing protein n=1 Tax=Timema monikensis TaxID=170555 RepID=A0A7R9HK82_9NEOP|nr:unnamed protein product [Timema monikensis]